MAGENDWILFKFILHFLARLDEPVWMFEKQKVYAANELFCIQAIRLSSKLLIENSHIERYYYEVQSLEQSCY